jgi:hypothetical protein
MKKISIAYWVVTILFAGFMIWTSIPGARLEPQAVKFLHDYLGYPLYFIHFISVAKILGGIALLIPGLKTLKEWAYAGMFFDLVGAIFSVSYVAGKFDAGSLFVLLPIAVGAVSYYLWKRTETAG